MPVLINFKICDNDRGCSGIEVCPTGALSWNEKKGIVIDNAKCISCFKCQKVCIIDAIKVAKDEKEYQKLKNEIDDDPRKVIDLYIDRYGAKPIHPGFLISFKRFEAEVLDSRRIVAAEFFEETGLECMLRSISIKKLLGDTSVKYRKLEVTEKDRPILEKYNVKKLPALLFFKDRKLIGKIESYYNEESFKKMKKKIEKILAFKCSD